MTSTSSINFQPVQSNSEAHNQRRQNDKNGYIKSHLSADNESWVRESIKDRKLFVQDRCKELSGRKLQKNATPIREGVLNIKPDTTMDDLHRLADILKEKYQIDVFQIYIHRDEGRVVDGEMKLNHHAHILVDWTDPVKGKMLRLNRQDMRDIQTLTAEVLGMKRGKPSDLDHLTVNEYKAQQIAKEKLLKEYREVTESHVENAETARKKYWDTYRMIDDARLIRDHLDVEIDQLKRKVLQAREQGIEVLKKALQEQEMKLENNKKGKWRFKR